MKLDTHLINKIILQPEDGLHLNEYLGEIGDQHYKLLAWLSTQFNNVDIFDIGTHMGASSSALSYNITNTIHSFDINLSKLVCKKENCKYYERKSMGRI
jgi:predicted O-methyltransferase YrrM